MYFVTMVTNIQNGVDSQYNLIEHIGVEVSRIKQEHVTTYGM